MIKLFLKIIFAIVLTAFSKVAFCQQSYKAVVHFATDKHSLPLYEIRYLDSFLSALPNIPEAFRFTVTGHTDNIGLQGYNYDLSARRAEEVAKFLNAKGFKQHIMLKGKGNTLPVANNTTDDGKQMNRRAEIYLQLMLPKLNGLSGAKNETEHRTMKADEGATLKVNETKLKIPPSAFVDSKGNVVKGVVHIVYTEYRDPLDFLLSGIPMHYHTGNELLPFNSAGMFSVNASQNNQQLFLQQGKSINVGFNYNNTIPDLNFYFFDLVTNQWKLIRSLEQRSFSDGGGSSAASGLCWNDGDYEKVFMVYEGLKYANIDKPLLRSYVERQTFIDKAKKLGDTASSFFLMMKNMSRRYAVDVTEPKKWKKEKFKLYAKENTPESFRLLNDVTFARNLSKAVIDSLSLGGFEDFSLEKQQEGWTLTLLYPGGKSLRINNLKIKVENTSAKQAAVALQAFAASHKKDQKLFEAYHDSAKEYVKAAGIYNTKIWELDSVLKGLQADSLTCFRKLNELYMSMDEKKLSFNDWLCYFDENKPNMRLRYDTLKMKEEFVQAEQRVKERQKQQVVAFDSRIGEITAKDLGIKDLSIQQLGIYNCDQLYKLDNPVPMYVEYKTSSGKEVKPVVALLMDSKLNGLLCFDGNYGLSPYKIAFSPKSVNRMVIVTAERETYIVSPEVFAGINPSGFAEPYSLTVSPLRTVKNKKELKVAMKM